MERDLLLYKMDACPYCIRVMNFMQANQIEIPQRSTDTDPAARADLIEAGGKAQVPALQIDGEILYESGDIIAWMEEHLLE
ncbi:MAG: glutathione S-transferase N-terminal domain-containing protein [Caldilineaceae bacterium]|nr:glutathione S-transferase N-terminal domain-containing protein [Caldilineaceae bacterium]